MQNHCQSLKAATKTLFIWTSLWLVTLAVAKFGNTSLWPNHQGVGVILLLVNLAVGVLMLRANALYISALDELQARIHLRAMAVTLGGTLILGVSLSAIDKWGIVDGASDVSVLLVCMSLIYLSSIVIEQRRYE